MERLVSDLLGTAFARQGSGVQIPSPPPEVRKAAPPSRVANSVLTPEPVPISKTAHAWPDFVWDRLVVWVTVRTLIDWAHVLCDVELKAHEHYVRWIHGAERSIRLLMPTSKELRLLRRHSGTMAVSTAEE